MRSPGVGGFLSGMPSAPVFTGTATFNKTAASGAETVATFKVSDDATGKLDVYNTNASDTRFNAGLLAVAQGSNPPLTIKATAASDTGTNAGVTFDTGTGAAAFATRPLYNWQNNGTLVLSALPLNSGANLALSWGTQTGAAPAFTTRSAGQRIILYNAITGSKVDNAIGVTASGAANTYSVQEATSSYSHDFYGGTTLKHTLRGDGLADHVGTVRATGLTAPTAGSGLELFYDGSNAIALAYNRTGAAYLPLELRASTVKLCYGTTPYLTMAAASVDMSVPVTFKSYTVATLPSAATAGQMIYVSNTAGGAGMAFSNGTNWLRCDTSAVIS